MREREREEEVMHVVKQPKKLWVDAFRGYRLMFETHSVCPSFVPVEEKIDRIFCDVTSTN